MTDATRRHARAPYRLAHWMLIAGCVGGASAATAQTAKDAKPVETETLAPVVVNSTRAQPAGKLTMTGEELSRIPGTAGDPIKALQSLPGVVTTSDGDGSPAIRGSRPSDNAYYIDFLPVGYMFHAGGFVSVVHADLVKQFDLYTAAFGPEYDDVHGGIIDVTLRKPRTDKFAAKVNVSLFGADVLLEGPVSDNQSFYFAAKRSYFDLLYRKDITDDDSGVIFSLPRYGDYQGKYVWRLSDRNELTFSATGADDKIKFTIPNSSTTAQHEPVLAGDSTSEQSTNTQAMTWDASLSAHASNKLALGHSDYRSKGKIGSAVSADLKFETLFAREQFRFRPNEDHDIAVGGILTSQKVGLDLDLLDAHCTEFDPKCDLSSANRYKIDENIKVNTAVLYAKDRWQLAPNWATTVGVHYSHNNYLNRSYIEPRLGLEWRASNSTTVNAAWGKHNEMPDGIQILKDIGNAGLGHMRATHSVLGLTHKLNDGWSVKTEAYYKKFNDFVVADPLVNYVNGGSGEAKGVEFFIKKERTSKFSGWLSVGLSKTRRRNDIKNQEFRFEYDQPVIINVVADYKPSSMWTFVAKWS